MTEPQSQPPKPLRTWRPMLLWSAAIVAAAGVAWFVGAELVPFLRTRSVVAEFAKLQNRAAASGPVMVTDYVERIGPPGEAARRLAQYVRLPHWCAPHKRAAITVLGCCGRPAIPALLVFLDHPQADTRDWAAAVLGSAGRTCPEEVIPALVRTMADRSPNVRCFAAYSLALLGDPGYAALKEALKSTDPNVVSAARVGLAVNWAKAATPPPDPPPEPPPQ